MRTAYLDSLHWAMWHEVFRGFNGIHHADDPAHPARTLILTHYAANPAAPLVWDSTGNEITAPGAFTARVNRRGVIDCIMRSVSVECAAAIAGDQNLGGVRLEPSGYQEFDSDPPDPLSFSFRL